PANWSTYTADTLKLTTCRINPVSASPSRYLLVKIKRLLSHVRRRLVVDVKQPPFVKSAGVFVLIQFCQQLLLVVKKAFVRDQFAPPGARQLNRPFSRYSGRTG